MRRRKQFVKIIRAKASNTDIFSEYELGFGACCFFTEDKACKYFFEIKGREATLFANTKQYISQAIKEFLFYSSFVVTIKDSDGNILLTKTETEPLLLEIQKIQPSQFYINEKKLESCKKWIKSPGDIYIPIISKDGKVISLDGHTRMRAAMDLGYTCVYVYPDEYDEYIFYFVDEAIKRQINSVSDMEIVSDEDYKLKWHKFCKDFFKRLSGE
jgi:hypothetical protein